MTPLRSKVNLVRRYQRELASRGRPAPLRARAAAYEHPAHRAHDGLKGGAAPPEAAPAPADAQRSAARPAP
jgi:hypothetical protein